MRLGYNTNGFAFHRLDDALHILAELGYEAVAITPDVHHIDPHTVRPRDLKRLALLLDDLGLDRVIETGARFVLDPQQKHRPTLLSPSPEERRVRRLFLERCIEIADAIGAGTLSVWSGQPDAVIGWQEGVERIRPGLERVLDRAERYGLKVGFEPEPGMWIESLAQYADLRDAVGRDDLGLTLDLGHLNVTEKPPYEPLVAAVAEMVVNVHVDDARGGVHRHLSPGDGEMPLESLLRILWDRGFAGVASVELSRHAHDAVRAARAARDYLRARWPGP